MGNEYVKKLSGKNPKDFEQAASHIINNCDLEAFVALIEQGSFLFDFIKKNVNQRLEKACNESNYKNLFEFLKYYSSDFEDFIINTLVKYADEDLTDKMLELLESGTIAEKTYSAKYFSIINDTLAIELLRTYAYSEDEALSYNVALALSEMKDEDSYNLAVEKIKSEDEFEKMAAIRFLVTYNDKKAVEIIFDTMKKSSMPENIASEISYLQSFLEFLDTDFKYDSILAINHIINGLGEIVPLSQLFDFQLYEVIDRLIEIQKSEKSGKLATLLLNAKEKFEQLTENDEYIFDEEKDIKNEVYEIKKLLNSQLPLYWNIQKDLMKSELNEDSDFVFSALELILAFKPSDIFDELSQLLKSENQTVVLKTIEVIKELGLLQNTNKEEVLAKISDTNIKAIINSIYGS